MKINNLDVLVVYSHKLATSAKSSPNEVTPFAKGSKNEPYNFAYSYFLKTCLNNKLKAAFTTSSDIIGAGKCSSFWLFRNDTWLKIKETGYSTLIFDKFSPVTSLIKQKRKLLFSSRKVKPFNSPYLFNLFFDKHKTFKKLNKFSVPTVAVFGNTEKEVIKSLKKLDTIIQKHAYKNDFSNEVVVKDRRGAGGLSVFKFEKDNVKDILNVIKNVHKTFIFQPYVKFDKGFSHQNSFSPTDIRLIFLGGKIIQTYIRIAKQGDFRCNEHCGGSLIYVSKNEIPENVMKLSKEIALVLGNDNSLFSLDFITSNNKNVFLLEGNTGPGLDWNTSIKVNEIEAKKLIRIIVTELAKRTNSDNRPATRKTYRGETDAPIPITKPSIPLEQTFI